MKLSITLNGVTRGLTCDAGDSLLDVLRREGCFSVRYGSDTGETGAAAVLLDGRLVSADVLLAAQADGHVVTTVESLNLVTGEMDPIQEAFVEAGALQSGYSAGSMVLATKALLERGLDPTDDQIRDALSGILDRETGYTKVIEAVRRAAAVLRGEKPNPMEPLVVESLSGNLELAETLPPLAFDVSPAVPRLVTSPDVPETAVVGKPEHKVEALRLVKGNAAFADDIELRGMLYAKVLRSPHAHARIVAIDDSKARALPGVHAVVHHGNTPAGEVRLGGPELAQPASSRRGELRRQGALRRRSGRSRRCRVVGDRRGGVSPDQCHLRGPASGLGCQVGVG